MTFKTLQDDCLERANFDNTQTTSVPRTRFKRFINTWHRRILSMPTMRKYREAPTTISVVAGTSDYVIATKTIREIYDATNQWRLEPRTLEWLRQRDPGQTATGTPVCWIEKSRTSNSVTVTLWPPPLTNNTLNLDADAPTVDLVNDSDLPLFDEDFHYLLAEGALYQEYMRMGDIGRSQVARQEIQQGITELRKFNLRGGAISSLKPARTTRAARLRSRLGPNYPADW